MRNMPVKSRLLLATLCFFTLNAAADTRKQLVGATEIIEVQGVNLRFKARIDTGAQTSSIHAEDIVIDANGDPVGKPIAFTLVNSQGQSGRLQTHVAKSIKVKTSEGSESRYAVPLTLTRGSSSKTVLVTLNDRKHMKYAILLGRNWLRGDFIVDVELNDDD